MSPSTHSVQDELAAVIASGNWSRLLRVAVVLPHSLDVEGIATSLMKQTEFRDREQLRWLTWFIDASLHSFPELRFVDSWSAEELTTLEILPYVYKLRMGLNNANWHGWERNGLAQTVEGLLHCAVSLNDPFLGCFAGTVNARFAASAGHSASSLMQFLEVDHELQKHETEWPILTERMRFAVAELGRDTASESNKLAVRAFEADDFEFADAVFPLALRSWEAFSESGNDAHDLTWSRIAMNYANLVSKVHGPDESLELHNRVVLRRREFVHDRDLPWQYELGNALRNYAGALHDSHQIEESLARANEGIEVVEPVYAIDPTKYSELLGGLLTNRCRTLLVKQEFEQALSDAQRAVALRRKDFDHRRQHGDMKLIHSLSLNIGCLSASGSAEEAERLLREAFELIESNHALTIVERNEACVSLHLSIAEDCEAAGRREDALQHSLKAEACSRVLVDAGLPEVDQIAAIAAVGRRALAAANGERESERLELAERMFLRVAANLEIARAKSDNKSTVQALEYGYCDTSDALIELSCRTKEPNDIPEEVLKISEAGRMRSLGEVIDLQFDNIDGLIPCDLLNELRAVRSDLDRVNDKLFCSNGEFEKLRANHSSSDESDKALRQIQAAGLEMFQLDKNRFEEWLSRLYEKVRGYVPDFDPAAPEMVSIADVRALLPSEATALVHFHVGDRISVATVVTNRGAEVVQLDGARRTRLQQLTKKWGDGYSSSLNRKGQLKYEDWRMAMTPILAEVSAIIVQPVLDSLGGGIDRLVLIPHRELHVFPLHLCGGRQASLLIDEYAIQYCPSLLVMQRCQRRKRSAPQRLFTTEISSSADLRFAELEIRSLIHQFGDRCTLFGQGESRRGELIAAASEIDIFHHAGHGLHEKRNPLESALQLDAAEDMEELLSVRDLLEDIRLPSGNIAVLATCEGGIVQADAVDEHFGFPTAFLVAGMKASVTALWNAGDLETYLLMHRFYHFLSSGFSASESLSNAQAWMRGKGDCEGEGLWDGRAVITYVQKHCLFSGITDPEVQKFCEDEIKIWEDETEDPPFESPIAWGAFVMNGVDDKTHGSTI